MIAPGDPADEVLVLPGLEVESPRMFPGEGRERNPPLDPLFSKDELAARIMKPPEVWIDLPRLVRPLRIWERKPYWPI